MDTKINKLKNIITTFLLFTILYIKLESCIPSYESGYSYSTMIYEIKNNKKTETSLSGSLISYDKHLFEFIERRNYNEEINGETHEIIRSSLTFDTTSVYVVPIDSEFYFKFDSFSNKSIMVNYGKLDNKSEGFTFAPSQINTSEKIPETRLKDTLFSKMKAFYFDSTISGSTGKDSIIAKIFFIKNADILTVHRIYESNLIHGKYSLAGFYYHYIERDISILETMKDIRLLTTTERKICDRMIEKISKSTKK
jgi:hypothetical protein